MRQHKKSSYPKVALEVEFTFRRFNAWEKPLYPFSSQRRVLGGGGNYIKIPYIKHAEIKKKITIRNTL